MKNAAKWLAVLLPLILVTGCATAKQRGDAAASQVTGFISAADNELAPVEISLAAKNDTPNLTHVKAARTDLTGAKTAEQQQKQAADDLAADLQKIKTSFQYRAGAWIVKLIWGASIFVGLVLVTLLLHAFLGANPVVNFMYGVLTFGVNLIVKALNGRNAASPS